MREHTVVDAACKSGAAFDALCLVYPVVWRQAVRLAGSGVGYVAQEVATTSDVSAPQGVRGALPRPVRTKLGLGLERSAVEKPTVLKCMKARQVQVAQKQRRRPVDHERRGFADAGRFYHEERDALTEFVPQDPRGAASRD